ncbi:hypothetical protein [Mycobacteroides abscessus]|uniref:hypothetical protein n=1 Tax=Mycobacteroides abscessus TaxID=36809 RepID=UPI0009A8487E|nr:hypothetical protein [Mycobacteroides abscessus]SKP38481.1 Uncharacterised protein [Mycobacteroides abscessus subsp. abscessus]
MGRTYLIIGAGIGLGFWITNSLHNPVMGWAAFGLSVVVALGAGVWSLDSDGVKADVRELREARASIREVRSDTDDDREVLDYDDYDDYEDDDALPEEDIEFLRKVTDPAPSAPAQPAPPAGGGLLSSLRQQSQ